MTKLILYILVIPIVIYAMDGININNIFKKNHIYQARIFYVLLIFSMSYIICNFIYELLYMIR